MDWSLITGRGGVVYKREGGGACEEDLPLRKGGTEKVLAMLKGGGGGGTKSFHYLKGGVKFNPVFRREGCAKSFGLAIFPFCSAPPPPPRNY